MLTYKARPSSGGLQPQVGRAALLRPQCGHAASSRLVPTQAERWDGVWGDHG